MSPTGPLRSAGSSRTRRLLRSCARPLFALEGLRVERLSTARVAVNALVLEAMPKRVYATSGASSPSLRTLSLRDHHRAVLHGGDIEAADGWLSGWRASAPPGIQDFQIGPFRTRARNLTLDTATGIGRYTDRQIFNALRFGLRPAETPDVEITSTVPGQGNFPESPKYMAPPMPWTAWRHMADEDLWAMIAYLRHGLRPVRNDVPASDEPPDSWASGYTVEGVGPWPAHRSRQRARSRSRKASTGRSCCEAGRW
jgi:hypothetical protein